MSSAGTDAADREAAVVAPVNPTGGEQFVGLGNGGRDMHAADFSGVVEMSVDYFAGPEFDNSGGNYNGALTARPDNVAGWYSARGSSAVRGVDPSTDAWAPWFRVWDESDVQIVTDELIAYRFDGVEGFDDLSREIWYRIGVVIDTSTGVVLQLKSQELIPDGKIWWIDDPEGPQGQTLYIDGGAANTSPLERVGIYNVGNGTVSCFDNVYVGPPYDWETVGGGGNPEVFRRGDSDRNGIVELTDGIRVLNFLFTGGPAPLCQDAADTDDNGKIELTDAVACFGFLFLGAEPPPSPGPIDCGRDPTDDDFNCEEYDACP